MIYFDNAASTLPDKSVVDLFVEASNKYYANASAIHKFGSDVAYLIDKAKEQILNSLGLAKSHNIVFVSSATEANNLAIKGYLSFHKAQKGEIITSLIEHPSVLEVFHLFDNDENFKTCYLKPNKDGFIDFETFNKNFNNETRFVSIMGVNNETGGINEIEKISTFISKYPKCVFHCDAVQSFGKVKLDYSYCDFITISSHKIYGLKGIAALIYKKNLSFDPIINGGGQQSNLRSSTMDVPNILAFARAIRILNSNQNETIIEINRIIREYLSTNKDLFAINFSTLDNPYILNFSTLTKKASVVTEALSNVGIMVSSVSACSSKKEPISHTVFAITEDTKRSMNTIRLSFGKYNTIEEAKIFIKELDKIIREIK